MRKFLSPKQAEDFKGLLNGYTPNEESLEKFRESNFAVIAGPVAAGKDTLRTGLMKRHPKIYAPVLSTTTRPPRDGEVDRKTYHFRSVSEVENKLKKGEYLQGALVHNQQVSTMDIAEIEKLKKGQIGLSILIVQTEEQMYKMDPDIKTIFLAPPNLKTLFKRLESDRSFSYDEASRRLVAAKTELELALKSERYYCLISQNKETTQKYADKFFQFNQRDDLIDKQARERIRRLIDELTSHLQGKNL
jgi:guanylate kinase